MWAACDRDSSRAKLLRLDVQIAQEQAKGQ
jgi:hypothetical protein